MAPAPEVGTAEQAEARVELTAALRAAALHGYQEGIDNHFSLALPGATDRFLLNPYGPAWEELRASDLLVVDLEGKVVEGAGSYETTAFEIHRAVHLAAPENRCVMHTHMPLGTAVSTLDDGFDTALSQSAMYFHGRLAYVDYGGLALGPEEGERIAADLPAGVAIVVLRNHGILAVGPDVAEAWQNLYFFERACGVQLLAGLGQGGLRHPSPGVVRATAASVVDDRLSGALLFAAVRRRVDRECPGYAD